ncbi:E3 ubiquitin-protein ligase RNF4 [Manduca sexta]|uniref:RING-type domain-containing protein n=1 Tax=Manduca sexta TaxID=7130 RepID=A0A922C994_MANSE|nr:E3 ubiquitin-protein ligase RNF4 [Manduca sexta]KAG6440495.1 hypothetical protein O3G_MSEX001289 [Manduca sexta]
MNNNNDVDDFVDLTNSYILADHCAIADAIIDLDTDDSIIEENVIPGYSSSLSDTADVTHLHRDTSIPTERFSSKKVHQKKKTQKKKPALRTSINEAETKFGSCPVCWDELGKNPLASTKCGHVYCLKCLEKCLCVEKRCPTCRTILKGKSAYHPLYLPV